MPSFKHQTGRPFCRERNLRESWYGVNDRNELTFKNKYFTRSSSTTSTTTALAANNHGEWLEKTFEHAPSSHLIGGGVPVLNGEDSVRPLVRSGIELAVQLPHRNGLGVHQERYHLRPADILGVSVNNRLHVVGEKAELGHSRVGGAR